MKENNNDFGCVYLVGAGPGDRGLITVKGLNVLKNADVIIYDHLANIDLLKEARTDAEKIYVGKKAGTHALNQEQINDLLIEKARVKKVVARLKGGDPFVFGRGGEEALALNKKNIPFEIVPGITSGIAALAYAGIPVTHRSMATSVSFITGHEDPAKKNPQINWKAIASLHGTLVFYMGVHNLESIVLKLIKYGKSEMTPVAIIQKGTSTLQKTIVGKLGNIIDQAKKTDIKPPALVVVGEVVSLYPDLNWFEKKPLFGKSIVVTRARSQASELAVILESLGANIIMFPTIKIIKAEDMSPLDNAIKNLADYQWIIFTSVNGVESFFERLFQSGQDSRNLSNNKICAIGPSTADKLNSFGLKADIQPDEFIAEAIVCIFQKMDIFGKKILLPRTDIARADLRLGLEKCGAHIDEVITYQTCMDDDQDEKVIERIKSGCFDLITFTSSSTVKNFIQLIGHNNLKQVFSSASVASIGPITQKTAESYGLKVHIQPEKYTISDLVQSIVKYYK
ncbi:MAG: uroporphyrinogen-III C-methyltransferase [Candidatus Humimicrobiaceae bacterium]